MASMPLKLSGSQTNQDVLIEGYLKKQRNFLRNTKSYYTVIETNMFISTGPGKPQTLKYDLTNYSLRLSQKEKKEFCLIPDKENKLKLKAVRFICANVEERGLWYKRLQEILRTDDSEPLRSMTMYMQSGLNSMTRRGSDIMIRTGSEGDFFE